MTVGALQLEQDLKIPGLVLPVLSRYEHAFGINFDAVSLRLRQDLDSPKIEEAQLSAEQFKLVLDSIIEQSNDEFIGL